MPTRKLNQKNIRKISKVGGGKSFAVTIPIEYIRKLKWKEKQKITMKIKGRSIIIHDWHK
jgi:antitoxin component of MazEF toxin-antitoxin module